MSSLRNAVQRRNHRERAQPVERSKWGTLEKHKDYKLRAADHNAKKRKIKALKEKAATRNEDEFYFAMMNSSTQGGVRRAKRGEENSGGGGKSLDMDVVKLLKTQDQGYLQTMLQRTRKERERMEQAVTLHENGVGVAPSNRKVLYNEDGELEDSGFPSETRGLEENYALDGLDDPDGLRDEPMDSEGESSDDSGITPEDRKAKRLKKKVLGSKRKKLEILKEQEGKLDSALRSLDDQRARMNGTVGGTNKKGLRFRVRHRKR